MRWLQSLTGICVAAMTAQALARQADPSPWFENAAAASGIDFTWNSGHQADRYLLPESIGGGCALFDMDNDGDLDAYFVQAGSIELPHTNQPSRLYRNRGDGTFEDATEGSGADLRRYGMGVACGDYDNDGDVDLFVTALDRNTLLRNDGTGRFTDITAASGIAGRTIWSSSAAFVDYDADGDLDLFVCNYANWSMNSERSCFNDMGARDYCDPANYDAPSVDSLYRNNGDGTFADVSVFAGLEAQPGTGLGVACGDFNADGRIDIFVANDGRPNALWINRGDGTFRNEALERGCAVDEEGKPKAGMGVMAIDFNDDALHDLLICNLRRESDSMFMNAGGRFFMDATAVARLRGPTRKFTRFGLGAIDFNHDGALDIFETSGRVQRADFTHAGDPYAEPNLLMKGMPGQKFEEVRHAGLEQPLVHCSRGAAFGDIDNDGDIDVVVPNRDAPAYVLKNIIQPSDRWIMFRVVEHSGRDALGAVVTARIGQRAVTRIVQAAFSMNASNDPRVHIGLANGERVTAVSVRWTDGTIQEFGALQSGAMHTLNRTTAVKPGD